MPFLRRGQPMPNFGQVLLPNMPIWPVADETRHWKTILQGGSAGNIVPVAVGQNAQLITVAGPDSEAQVMSVTLIPPLIPGVFGANNALNISSVNTGHEAAFAVIQWGVAGGVANAEVDYGRGGSFSLVASAVRVFARREPAAGTFVPTPATVLLGAAISKRPIASPMKMTRSFTSTPSFPAGMLPADIQQITIPPYAKSFTAWSVPIAGVGPAGQQPMNIAFTDFNADLIGDFRTGLNQNPTKFDLPNQASWMTVQNASALNTVRMQFVFDLAL